MLFITHDMGVVAEIADSVLVLNRGRGRDRQPRRCCEPPARGLHADAVGRGAQHRWPPPRPEPQGAPLLAGESVSKTYQSVDWMGRAPHARAAGGQRRRARRRRWASSANRAAARAPARCLIRLIDPTGGSDPLGRRRSGAAGRIEPAPAARPRRWCSRIRTVRSTRACAWATLIEGAVNSAPCASRRARWRAADGHGAPAARGLLRYPSQFSGGQRQRLAIARRSPASPRC